MKVKVAELRKAIVKHRDADVARYEKELQEYEKQQKLDTKQRISNLRAYLHELESGKEEIDEYNLRAVISRGCKGKNAPHKAESYGDLLVKLDLCVTDTVTVDDNSQYMRFLSGKCVCSR